ncbi:DUF2283 domain-containing protein [Candidatus Parcubacteria bacterium]|nr:DUF2283 domain-containing protein [Candidatus Parcubacteria bacterium]
MEKVLVKNVYKSIPALLKFPSQHSWVDYDKEADVLYLSFEKPQQASDSEILDNDVILRRRNNKLVGMTILNASRQVV